MIAAVRAMSVAQENRAHTFQLAFTLAVVGIVFCVAGIAGYDLGKRAVLLAEDRWADGVIWWEIYFGIFLPLAPYTSARLPIELPTWQVRYGRNSYPTIIKR